MLAMRTFRLGSNPRMNSRAELCQIRLRGQYGFGRCCHPARAWQLPVNGTDFGTDFGTNFVHNQGSAQDIEVV